MPPSRHQKVGKLVVTSGQKIDERPHGRGRPSKKILLPLGDPGTHQVLWAHPSPHCKRHRDRFRRFCRTHSCVQQTDRHTDRPRTSVATSRRIFAFRACDVFPVAGANVWNGLPSDVTSASSLSVFKNRLKTYLYPVADPGFLQGGVRQLVPLECPKPLHALSPSDR